jgi:hypothetical protein
MDQGFGVHSVDWVHGFSNSENKPKNQLSQEFCKIAPWNFKTPYLFNHNTKSSDYCIRILRITSFVLYIHLTHVCCILVIDSVCFALGNAVPKPFFEDFQDQAFEESHFFFAKQLGKCPWPFCTYDFLVYSVEVELHDRSKCYANLC